MHYVVGGAESYFGWVVPRTHHPRDERVARTCYAHLPGIVNMLGLGSPDTAKGYAANEWKNVG